MKTCLTPVAAAVALALAGPLLPAQAQQAAAKTEDKNAVQTVQVVGVRAALQQSINQKRGADSLVEVITSEDIGKMPDKNIADSLQRVPGVTISSASASEGGFDEADRVSLRGTNPSLTQTMVNGHMVGSGDWFVLNQVGTVGRSISFSLLPSELVSRVVVRKSAQADLVEGGVAGTVDIITRKPLDFRKPLTLEAAVGAVYADLPSKTDPQLSGLLNWKNDTNTVGVMLQVFSQKRHLRRDGVETLGYGTIAPGSAIALAKPDLARRGLPQCHRLGAVRADAQARRRPHRHPGQARQRPELRPHRLSVHHGSHQLQPQLPGVAEQDPQWWRRPGARCRLRGAQRHPGAGQLQQPGHHCRAQAVRGGGPDPAARRQVRNRLPEPGRQPARERQAQPQRQAGQQQGQGRDAAPGGVRRRRVQHRRGLQAQRHRQRARFLAAQRQCRGLHRHHAGLGVRRQPGAHHRQGRLGADRRRVRAGCRHGEHAEVRRPLREAQPRHAAGGPGPQVGQ